MATFEALELSAPVMRAIEIQEFTAPTDIQTEAIPPLMEGKDLIGIAQTGGGKTAAFVIPLLEQLAKYEENATPGKPRALILAPTRELAQQIADCIKLFGRFMKLKSGTIYGGSPYRQQMFMLQKGVDILVATPGRLLDHTRRGNIKFDETDFFVLDEADRMLDMGFVEDVSAISDMMSADRQTVMFSATMNHKVRELTKKLMIQPVNVEIVKETTVATNIEHFLLQTDWRNKNDLLMHMINEHSPSRMLIFTRTKSDADQVAMLLRENSLQADAIHGDKKQRVRERVLKAFRNDRIQFLVATDVAARGIDVPDISHVVNMDMPLESENYVHRVGRTGRGGASGVAFSMCGRGDKGQLMAIERLIKQKIEVLEDHPYHIELKGKASGKPKGKFNKGPQRTFRGKDTKSHGGDRSSYRPEFAKSRHSDDSSQGENKGSFKRKPAGNFKGQSEHRTDGEKSFCRKDSRPEGNSGFRNKSDNRSEGSGGFKARSERRSDGEQSFRNKDSRSEGKSSFRNKSDNRSEGGGGFKARSERRNDGEKSFRHNDSRSEGKSSFRNKSDNRNEGNGNFKSKSENRSEGKSSFKSKSENRKSGENAFRHKDSRPEGKAGFKSKSDAGKGKFKGKGKPRKSETGGNKPLKRKGTGNFKKAA